MVLVVLIGVDVWTRVERLDSQFLHGAGHMPKANHASTTDVRLCCE